MDFHALLKIYLATRNGLVVLTNSQGGSSVIIGVAQRALGGKAAWSNH